MITRVPCLLLWFLSSLSINLFPYFQFKYLLFLLDSKALLTSDLNISKNPQVSLNIDKFLKFTAKVRIFVAKWEFDWILNLNFGNWFSISIYCGISQLDLLYYQHTRAVAFIFWISLSLWWSGSVIFWFIFFCCWYDC